MTDPLRAEVERLSEEWEKEAARRRKDAARPGEPPSSRRMLECGAAFELSHAALLRAALRSTEPPAPRCTGHCHCHAGADGIMHPPCCEECAPSARSPEPEGGGREPTWQCSSCGWGFLDPWQKKCPACGRTDYWSGSVYPNAVLWTGQTGRAPNWPPSPSPRQPVPPPVFYEADAGPSGVLESLAPAPEEAQVNPPLARRLGRAAPEEAATGTREPKR